MSTSTSTENKKTLTLKSSDGEVFEVDEAVAMLSQTIKLMVEDDCAYNVIPLANVTGSVLAKVLEYCKKHAEEGGGGASAADKEFKSKSGESPLKEFDAEYIKVGLNALYDLIWAANYLHIEGLLDLACQTVADINKGKSPEQIRKAFNIKNDFTPEEEEAVRRENQWAFEFDE